MNYPLISEYIEAIKASEDNFEQLKHLRPVLDEDGEPIMTSGNFAVVFKMKDEQTGKLHAVKCFLKEQEGREDNYTMISKELQKVDSPYIIQVNYLKNELFVDTAQSDEKEYPVLLMDWVEGKTLSSFLHEQIYAYNEVKDRCSDEEEDVILFELKCLPGNFIRMALWLLKQSFAHGDIKPDNIIIKPDGTFVLVDYDGMFVPAMQGMNKIYLGTPNYRNPLRARKTVGKDIDDYSVSVIGLSLCAYSIKPVIAYQNDEYCIITEEDVSTLHTHWLFKDDKLMMSPLFRELLSIYLHTISNGVLDAVYYEKCVAEHLCPSSYDLFSTAATDFELEHFWEDEYGVRYSLDGRKVLQASKQLKELNYKVREGVITICDQAFQSKGLKSICIPDSVNAIGDRAFANNDDMEYCNIPTNVKFIYENNPWGGCFNIKKIDCLSSSFIIDNGILYSSDYQIVYGLIYWHPNITIDSRSKKIVSNAFWSNREKYDCFISRINLNEVKEIGYSSFNNCSAASFTSKGVLEEIGEKAFWGCKFIEKVDVSGVSEIPKEAFIFCDQLREVKLSSKLNVINSWAFGGCVSLERLDIPSTTTFISESSISGCTALKEFIVHEDNKCYRSIDGVLFNKGLTKLIKYPAGKIEKEFEIPNSVYEIEDRAFEDCVNIECITSKNNIIHFGQYVFKNCPNLKHCMLSLDDRTDADSAWNLGSFLFPLKNASPEMKANGFSLISKAAEKEHSIAQWYLARCYKYGWNGEVSIDKYISFMKRSAANNNFSAMSQLGIEFATGNNIAKNYKAAYELFHKLEESGTEAEKECKGNFFAPLGFFHENGVIVSKDEKKAVDYYSHGKKWDNPVAIFQLARCYENGIGVEVNLGIAKLYYTEAQKHKFKGASEAIERVDKLIQADPDYFPF